MGYIERTLMDGEYVYHRTKLHWVLFVGPAVLFIVAVIIAGSGGEKAAGAAFFIFVALVWGFYRFARYLTSEFVVTNRRVIVKQGIISRKLMEIPLQKVESINVDQGAIARLLGYGTVTISGTGGSKEIFKRVASPFEVRKKVQERVAAFSQ